MADEPELFLWVADLGWCGAFVVVAETEDEAREIMGSPVDPKLELQKLKIKRGLEICTHGDL